MTILEKIQILIEVLERYDTRPEEYKRINYIEIDNYWMLPQHKNKIDYEHGRTFLKHTKRFKEKYLLSVLEKIYRDTLNLSYSKVMNGEEFKEMSKEEIQAEMRRCNRLWKEMKKLGEC